MRALKVRAEESINYAFLPFVPWIALELTNHCGQHCPFCGNQFLTRPRGCIDWKLLEKLVDECSGRPYGLHTLHGAGDPLLFERLEEAIRLIRSKNAGHANFATDGALLTVERSKSLLAAGLTSISFWLDSLDPAIYRLTKDAELEQVIDNIRQLMALAPPSVVITLNVMEHKHQEVTEETMQLFRQTFGERPNVHFRKHILGLLPPSPADFRRLPCKWTSCSAPAYHLSIAWDGRVAICNADQDCSCTLGNVKEQTIEEIWFSRKSQTLFRNIMVGVFECPEVCVKRCHLQAPRKPRGSYFFRERVKISPGNGLPYEDAFELAKQLLAAGNRDDSHRIASEVRQRAPWNCQEVDQFLKQHWPDA